MSTLTDCQYAKYRALKETPNDLSQINFDDVIFFEPDWLDSTYHVAKKILSGTAKGFRLVGKVFREGSGARNKSVVPIKVSPGLIRWLH